MDLTTFFELFTWPLVSLLLIALVAPVVGAFLYARGESFQGIVLPQIATFGVALGYALHPLVAGTAAGHPHAHAFEEPSRTLLFAWAGLATAGGLTLLAWSGARSARGAGGESARVAAAFAIASGGTVIASQLAPMGGLHVNALLFGETLATNRGDAVLLALVSAGTLIACLLGWRELTLVGHDRTFARAAGVRVTRWNMVLYTLVGCVVMVGALTVGPMPLFALLVLPPLAARKLSGSMARFLFIAPSMGLAGAAAGAAIAFAADLPVGASVVAGAGSIALLAVIGGRRMGH